MRARLAAVATAVVLALAGCDDPFVDDPARPAPKELAPSGHRSEGPRNPTPTSSPRKTPSKDPSTKPPSPRPWVPKGPAVLVGCGTHASGYVCRFHGYNFEPGEKVRLTRGIAHIGGNVFTADEDGEFNANLASNARAGIHTYVAQGQTSNRQASTTVRITPGLWD